MDDEPPYILINWTDGCERLKTAGSYLAIVAEDGLSCTVVRVIEPAELPTIREKIEAAKSRGPKLPTSQARAQVSSQRTPPIKEGRALWP